MELGDRLAAAARVFVDGLDGEQAGAALLPFEGEERRSWAYWPAPRRGVPVWSLDRGQAKAAHRLLAVLLPVPAYARVVTIMSLDEVLDRLEGYRSDRRHGGDYWLSVFGSPGHAAWGMRFEGHHVSVHATVVGREVRLTPLFLGANPAAIYDGADQQRPPAVAPLALEEALGFELLHALTSEQRSSAVVSDEAPADIISRNAPGIGSPPPEGVPVDALTGPARTAARSLLDLYMGRFPDGAPAPDPRDAFFAWAGAQEPGTGHYYRIAGPRLLIEFDNTQDGANHIHTVVRDAQADFGTDLLAAHHRQAHPPP